MVMKTIRNIALASVFSVGAMMQPLLAADVVLVQSSDAVSLDPAFRADSATGNVQRHIFDTILFRDADMEIVPSLAESVEQTSPTEWTIKLRADVKFSNGEPFNAEAVKYSIERMQDPELKSPIRGWWTGFTKIEAAGDLTLNITTAEVDPLFRARMTLLAPVPPKYLEEVGAEAFGQKPIGTGPYVLDQWRHDEAVDLTSNSGYWGEAPSVKRVTFRVVPEELSRVSALQTGEADVVAGLSPLQATSLENAEGLRVEKVPTTRVMTIQFDSDMAPGDNQAFRDAVAYAIDRDSIISGFLRGFGEPVNSILSPGIPGWDKDIDYVKAHDMEKARQLVKDNGLDQAEIELKSPSGRYPLDREIALVVGEQLKQAGMNVVVRPEEWGRFFDGLKNHQVSAVYLTGQGNVWLDPYPQLEAFQKSDGFLSTWSDPEFDTILGKTNEVDGDERKALFGDALQRLNDTTAVIPLFAQQALFGVRDRVEWTPRPDEQIYAFEIQMAE